MRTGAASRSLNSALAMGAMLFGAGCTSGGGGGWSYVLKERVAIFGHRNWICVVDAAYPAQSGAGIETILTGSDHLAVVKTVLDELRSAPHVRPHVLLDRELESILETDAPGIARFRDELKAVLAGVPVESRLHAEVITDLDEAGGMFYVLVLKTTLTLPYTSVFIRLECGYWSEAQERRLRGGLDPPKR